MRNERSRVPTLAQDRQCAMSAAPARSDRAKDSASAPTSAARHQHFGGRSLIARKSGSGRAAAVAHLDRGSAHQPGTLTGIASALAALATFRSSRSRVATVLPAYHSSAVMALSEASTGSLSKTTSRCVSSKMAAAPYVSSHPNALMSTTATQQESSAASSVSDVITNSSASSMTTLNY